MQLRYDCGPQDEQNLELLQRQIQERVKFLHDGDMDSYGDPDLLKNYELHAKIQQCLFQDHTDQYVVIMCVVVGISLLVYVRLRMIKKVR